MKATNKSAITFAAVTICFALWGFANDVTNPMVEAFSKIFRMSTFDGTLVQMAFYGGYFVFALPAALYIRRYDFKNGLLVGLALFAIGSFGFLPAAASGSYYPFLISYFVLTCGLSFLETSANPCILSMGDASKSAYRLNLAQAFNPIGSLLGMFVAMLFVQEQLSPLSSAERALLNEDTFEAVKNSDLLILAKPYILIGLFSVVLFIIIRFVPMQSSGENDSAMKWSEFKDTMCRILRTKSVKSGFLAQFFYVGAQIMCWTFIIHYGKEMLLKMGDMTESDAAAYSQRLNIVAMVLFCVMRFVFTYLMRFFSPARLLAISAGGGILLSAGTIIFPGWSGMVCLIGISASMSLMFPTIYSLALRRLTTEDSKIGAATQIMAILGGSILPMIQAGIIDCNIELSFSSPVAISFIVPLISFVVILLFAIRQREA
ncbi:MAG: L-fucose:H+ symporter permease [Marinilabiliaceae bacterium]|nr:L-fucose:H+ symporter permease [Marinilabiliaceae bacterium]